MYVDLSEPKHREDAGIKHLNDSNAFIECSNTMDGIYKNIGDYNSNRERKKIIVLDDMIADIIQKKRITKYCT